MRTAYDMTDEENVVIPESPGVIMEPRPHIVYPLRVEEDSRYYEFYSRDLPDFVWYAKKPCTIEGCLRVLPQAIYLLVTEYIIDNERIPMPTAPVDKEISVALSPELSRQIFAHNMTANEPPPPPETAKKVTGVRRYEDLIQKYRNRRA